MVVVVVFVVMVVVVVMVSDQEHKCRLSGPRHPPRLASHGCCSSWCALGQSRCMRPALERIVPSAWPVCCSCRCTVLGKLEVRHGS